MNARYNNYYAPRAPAFPAQTNARGSGAGAKGGGNTGLIVAVVFGFLLSAGTAAWFMRGKSTTPDQSQAMTQVQAVTNPPATSSPLCPNNYLPVTDRNGKIYQNSCYADSVGAQYAPTPYTTAPTAGGGATSAVDPVTAALLARLAPGMTLPPGTGVRTTKKPVVINQGAQKFEGGSFVQAASTRAPLLPPQDRK